VRQAQPAAHTRGQFLLVEMEFHSGITVASAMMRK
jgi:hypothetical protein